MSDLTVDWKYKGKYLKMGIKKYRIPGEESIRV